MQIAIDGARITSWGAFHDAFAEALGFPGFYGRNMDAWIDCMSYLDDPEAAMSGVHVPPGDMLTIAVSHSNDLIRGAPLIYKTLVECTSFVNQRFVDRGEQPILALSFDELT